MSEKVAQRLFTFIAILALLLGMGGTGQVSAQDPAPRPQLPLDRYPKGAVDLTLFNQVIERGGTANVVVILEQPDLITQAVEAQQNGLQFAPEIAQAELNTIRRAQDALQAQLESPRIGGTVLFKNQRVYNGIALKVEGSRLPQIAALPGVSQILPLEMHTVDNSYAAELIGAKSVWDSEAGELSYTGKGVRIAIIDTGIDFVHANFGGDKKYENAADLTDDFTTENDTVFPTAKVKGGYDFAGDAYNPSDNSAANDIPMPDPIPMDCNGHGSHVAGSAAGYGVNSDGTTYTGPWTSAIDTMSLRIGPGMAPQAELYALRVFGCEGGTLLTDKAVEWAVDPNDDGDFSDSMHVINLSLGSDFGSQESSSVLAVERAVNAGVIVVASSGNSGDTSYISGSPAVATQVINVAATVDAYSLMDGFEVISPESIAGTYGGSAAANWPAGVNEVEGTLKYPSELTNNTDGCAAFDPGYFAGQIALLDWLLPSECGSAARAKNATDAGAIGVLMIYDAPVLEITIAGSNIVPSLITTQDVGEIIKTALAAGPVTVKLDRDLFASLEVIDTNLNDMVAGFSSRGPRTGDVGLKPDIAAPGMTIFSTATGRFLDASGIIQYGSGDEGASFNGTSMASPIVAGSMAILREQHPTWTVEELKALVMNTATNDLYSGTGQTGEVFSPVRVGAGRINVANATMNNVIAYNDDTQGAVSVSFGHVEVESVYNDIITVTVDNKGASEATYNLAYRAVTDNPGVTFELRNMADAPITSLTVPAGMKRQFQVRVTATAANLRNVRDAAFAAQQDIGGELADRIWLSDESGLIEFTGAGLTELRLPVHIAAVPVSNMKATTHSFPAYDESSGTINVNLTGTGVNTAGDLTTPNIFPENYVSLVSVFELVHKSEQLPTASRLRQMADLQAVGIATDAMTTTPDLQAIYFGIATYGEWSTPTEIQVQVYFDVDQDGGADFVLITSPLASASGDATDVHVSALINLVTFETVIQGNLNFDYGTGPSTQLLNNNVMVLPVYAHALGLSTTDSDFDYLVVTFSSYFDGAIDATDWMTYDISNPVIDVSGGERGMPMYVDLPGTVIPVNFDRTGANAGKEAPSLLLLHHHNAQGTRVETLSGIPIFMPVVFR